MSHIQDEVLAAHAAYASDFGDKAALPMPPDRCHSTNLLHMTDGVDQPRLGGLLFSDLWQCSRLLRLAIPSRATNARHAPKQIARTQPPE